MKCSENLQTQIDSLAAGELSPVRAWAVGRHVRGCADCSARLVDARALLSGLGEFAEEAPTDMLRQRVFDALPNAATPLSHSDGRGVGGEGAVRSGKRLRFKAAFGICAIIVVILFSPNLASRKMAGKVAAPQWPPTGGDPTAQMPTLAGGSNLAGGGGMPAASGGPPAVGGEIISADGHMKYQVAGVVRRTSVQPSKSQPEDLAEADSKPTSTSANPFTTQSSTDRYLIRNAILTMEVKDARSAHTKLLAAVQHEKGYLSNLQETVDGLGQRTITLEVRVPANLFDGSMQALSDLGKVMDKHVTAEDVTEEFVDTESTLRNQKRTEERLLAHLSRTGKLSDTLLVETELTRVREEIEKHEGRLRFLSHRIQFSTINVTLREAAKALAAVPAASYSTGKEATDATRSLVEFLRSVWTTTIWIGIWAIVWAPLALIAGFGLRKVWRAWMEAGRV